DEVIKRSPGKYTPLSIPEYTCDICSGSKRTMSTLRNEHLASDTQCTTISGYTLQSLIRLFFSQIKTVTILFIEGRIGNTVPRRNPFQLIAGIFVYFLRSMLNYPII